MVPICTGLQARSACQADLASNSVPHNVATDREEFQAVADHRALRANIIMMFCSFSFACRRLNKGCATDLVQLEAPNVECSHSVRTFNMHDATLGASTRNLFE